MKFSIAIFILIFLALCSKKLENSIIFSGDVDPKNEFIVFANDTIDIQDGKFLDTIEINETRYDYIKIDEWKWPKLIFIDKDKNLKLDLRSNPIYIKGDPINTFLLNSDSILIPYSLRWDMKEEDFRKAIKSELAINFKKIDSTFIKVKIPEEILLELKLIEKLKVGHRTANFISFQERKGNHIDRDIYNLIGQMSINNKRLEFQTNNRNYQYYALTDDVKGNVPDSIYPFEVIEYVNERSTIESIRKMIISATVKSAFYDNSVDHDKLIKVYEENFGKLKSTDPLLQQYNKIQKLKPGNPAPGLGEAQYENGLTARIYDFKGDNILLTVWGTWCPYCKEELPHIKKLIDKYGDKFTSVGVSLDKEISDVQKYVEENNWEAIHLIDPKRNSTFKSNYMANGTNVHYLFDRNGIILSERGLKPSSPKLEQLIKELK